MERFRPVMVESIHHIKSFHARFLGPHLPTRVVYRRDHKIACTNDATHAVIQLCCGVGAVLVDTSKVDPIHDIHQVVALDPSTAEDRLHGGADEGVLGVAVLVVWVCFRLVS